MCTERLSCSSEPAWLLVQVGSLVLQSEHGCSGRCQYVRNFGPLPTFPSCTWMRARQNAKAQYISGKSGPRSSSECKLACRGTDICLQLCLSQVLVRPMNSACKLHVSWQQFVLFTSTGSDLTKPRLFWVVADAAQSSVPTTPLIWAWVKETLF